MKIIRGYNSSFTEDGIGLSIGVFDGVHLGHQAIIKQLINWGEKTKQPIAVMTFEPSPIEFLKPNQAPPRLTQLNQKIDFLQSLGISAVFILQFDERLANMSPIDFISKILVSRLKVQHLVIGYDWQFGKNRSGTPEILEKHGKKYGFGVSVVNPKQIDGQSIHSTKIRSAIADGNLNLASEMLSRPYTLRGRVVIGNRRGRQIGFPTANIEIGRQILPPSGVYATIVALNSSGAGLPKNYGSVTNIGIRPTFGQNDRQVEVHLFNFDQDIYGQELDLIFQKKIRTEREFPNSVSLIQQIHKDIKFAKSILGNLSNS